MKTQPGRLVRGVCWGVAAVCIATEIGLNARVR